MKTIGIGKQSFASLRENDCFYVDKTDFIQEWWNAKDDVTLITRPRRFGKTLNMSTVECFFSNRYRRRADLFEGLRIWEHEMFRRLQGTFPVIFLSFADVKSTNYDEALVRMKQSISDLYNANDFLLGENLLNENERQQFLEVCPTMPNPVAEVAIRNLANYLSRYFGKNVIVLLDEYDTPLQEAYVNGYWEELAAFTRGLFNATFKTNPYLERGLMTGITRVSKESIFSDLNNIKIITTTSTRYATAFGFTEKEVFSALENAGMSERKADVKAWYDGFTFGGHTDIYNPWSITNFLDSGKLETYWAGSSSNSLVSKLIQSGSVDVKKHMETLLSGGCIQVSMDEQIVFEQLSRKKNAIWSLLLASGYLKVVYTDLGNPSGYVNYRLALTNREIHIMFEDMIRDWFTTPDIDCGDFFRALLAGDKKVMNHYMNKVAIESFSYFDTGKHSSGASEPERFYHGFVLGLIVDLNDRYTVTSNRESGFGRYDVMLEPKPGLDLDAIVMEFKVHEPEDEKQLADTVAAALRQIEEKQYDVLLLTKGISKDRIRHYGFAFEGKNVLIG